MEWNGTEYMTHRKGTSCFIKVFDKYIYWVGQKVCLGFSVRACEKPKRTFWPTQYTYLCVRVCVLFVCMLYLSVNMYFFWGSGFLKNVKNLPSNNLKPGNSLKASIGDWFNKLSYIHTMDYQSLIRKRSVSMC